MGMVLLRHINAKLMLGKFTFPWRPPIPHETIWMDLKWASEKVLSGRAEGWRLSLTVTLRNKKSQMNF